MALLVWPVRPYRGSRNTDAWGSGVFGASRDGGKRTHRGADYTVVEGDDIVSPIGGVIAHVGIAKPHTTLGSIHIRGMLDHWPFFIKIFYLDPLVIEGQTVMAGDRIGVAQNVAAHYEATAAHAGHMTNHVHMEVQAYTDPLRLHGPLQEAGQ